MRVRYSARAQTHANNKSASIDVSIGKQLNKQALKRALTRTLTRTHRILKRLLWKPVPYCVTLAIVYFPILILYTLLANDYKFISWDKDALFVFFDVFSAFLLFGVIKPELQRKNWKKKRKEISLRIRSSANCKVVRIVHTRKLHRWDKLLGLTKDKRFECDIPYQNSI